MYKPGYFIAKLEEENAELREAYKNAVWSGGASDELYYLGYIFRYNKYDFFKMRQCWYRAVDLGNVNAMFELAKYYFEIEHNYREALRYLKMAPKNDTGCLTLMKHVEKALENDKYYNWTNYFKNRFYDIIGY